MAGSKGKPFVLQHCYTILEHCSKWKERDQEIKPKKGTLLELDDSEDENGGRNKDKPHGNKKAKERIKLEAEATNLRKNIEEMVKSKEVYMDKALRAKIWSWPRRKMPSTKLGGKQSGRMTTARPPWRREDSH
jgi:hypothetical protein